MVDKNTDYRDLTDERTKEVEEVIKEQTKALSQVQKGDEILFGNDTRMEITGLVNDDNLCTVSIKDKGGLDDNAINKEGVPYEIALTKGVEEKFAKNPHTFRFALGGVTKIEGPDKVKFDLAGRNDRLFDEKNE